MFKENKAGSYIEFRVFDPSTNAMHRKTIKLNHITSVTERRKYVKELLKRINSQLVSGWNPWVHHDVANLDLD